ncbi:MAG: hypothetical protein PVJ67_00400 [Candidatus Pacearchaeota archaeon]|jgi:hypothetical protein
MDLLDFTKLRKKPDITARFNLPEKGMRIYVYGDIFEFGTFHNARDHVLETFEDLELIKKADYFIVLPWENGEDKMIDFFSYSLRNFPKNEESPSIYTRNGKRILDGSCCLDGRLICGAEEFYRRTCHGVEEYVENSPKFKGLKLSVDE